MLKRPLTVAWISFFPVEWLPDLPLALQKLPRLHPAPWQRVLLNELKGCPDLKLHVLIVRKQFKRDTTFERGGVTFHCLRSPAGWRRASLFWIDTLLIKRCLRTIAPDLVHAWGTEDAAGLVASRLGYPFLTTVQGLMQLIAQTSRKSLFTRIAAYFESRTLARCHEVTGESYFSTNFLREHFPHLRVHHVDLAPDFLFQRVQRCPETRPIRFIFVGRLGFQKGGDVVLRAMNQLDADFRLLVVGGTDDALAGQLRNELASPLWSRIEFKQNLTSELLALEFSRATLMVCPTRVDTGPMAVKEAAVAGLPVIGSNVGGIPDYILPNKNGLLFPPGDADACASALRQALNHPLFRMGKVDEAILASVRQQLLPSRMADGFLRLYRKLVPFSTTSRPTI